MNLLEIMLCKAGDVSEAGSGSWPTAALYYCSDHFHKMFVGQLLAVMHHFRSQADVQTVRNIRILKSADLTNSESERQDFNCSHSRLVTVL
jgi:hypothetical protein